MSSSKTGEVAAISGYFKQYKIFATSIYDNLVNNEIEWIELASNKAGKLDDVLIGLNHKIVAYQIKNISSSNFSYSSFVSSQTESILLGSFNGWRKIKIQYPERKIDAKIVTNQSPSDDDRISSYKGTTKPSFKKFNLNFWKKIKSGEFTLNSMPSAWKPVFTELKELTKANENELIQFIKDLEFVFEYPEDENLIIDSYTWRKRKSDIDKITKSIFEIIGRKGNVKLTKENILTEFGLVYRYETHFKHSFFVDELHYQPIRETEKELDEISTSYDRGYIALIGTAGSGKSTLLTKWINNSKHSILKYYAYVNKDMNYSSGFRGEAKLFLKDLLVQIREKDYTLQDRLPTNDIEDLQQHFKEELDKISVNGGKTFILIDGLDHIEREQKINRSLISILPLPNQVPENIYFILGTRTIERLDDLPFPIKSNLINNERIITIKPLSKGQVANLTYSYELDLDQDQLEELYSNSKGHPLFLRYKIEEIIDKGYENFDSIVKYNVFSGDIFDEYRNFWNKVKDKNEFVELLGILSRFRYSYIDVKLLSNFSFSRKEAEEAKKMSEHYFFKKSNIWQFFHNSFKEFLVEETSKDFFSDEIDKQLDIDFHLKIYEGIKNLNNDEYRWNIIYHLFQAKKFDLITELTSQDYFRQQWYEYRNTTYIQEDINLTALASSFVKKPKSLLICSLSEYELRQRNNNFTPSLYYETFHQLSMIDVANSFIYNNVELLVEKEVALDYCIALFKQGLKKLSFEIFLKAEPTFILKNIKQVSPRKRTNNSVYEIDQIQLVKKWAKASSLFNPIDDILAKLKGFEVLKEFPVDENRDVLIESISEILQFKIDENDWDGLSELHDKVKHIIPSEFLFTFYFEVVWYLENENNFYEHCKSQLSTWVLKNDSPANLRLGLFEVIINDNVKRGKLAFEKTAHPLEKKVNSSSMNHAGSFNYVFNYSRLYYLLYKDFSKDTTQFLPEFNNTNLKAFCNEYAELGKSYAYIFLKKENASIQFSFRMKQIFNYFHNHITDRGHEYAIHENKADIIILILRLSTEVSDELLNRLLSEISVEWENNLRYWGESKQQEVIEWVIESGRNDEWCTDNLRRLNKSIFQDGYNTDRIEKGVSQIKLWSILGRIDEGKRILETLMEISLDVRGEKDDQIDYLVEWLGKFKEIDSDELKFYLEKLDSIYQKVNSASHTPAMEILRYSLNKGNGFEIFKYVLMEGLVGLNDGIEILLEHILKELPKKKSLLVSLYIRTVIAFDNIHYGRGSFLNNLLHYDLSTSEINKIVKDIKVYSILEHRNDYLNKIKKYSIEKNIDLQKIGIDDVIFKEKRDTSSYLSLKGGTTYSKDEAIQTIKDYYQLVESINGEEEHGYFKWISIIEKLSPNLSLVQLEELLKIKKFDGIDLLKFAEIFHSKGDLDKAKQLIEEALAHSTLNSWSEVYDNGLKIKAYNLYHKIEDKEIVQDKAVKDFSENFKIDHESVIAKYDSIFSLMFDEIQIEDLYTEINNYKNQLLKSHYTTEGTPPINGNLSTEELLYQTIIFLMEIPCRFDDIINEILLENIDQNKGLITVLLQRLFEEQYYDSFLKLIAGISLKDTRFLQNFTTEIVHLLNHERFDIHNIAIRVMDRMDLNVGEFYKVKTKREPLAYTLKLNKSGGLVIPEKDRIERVDRTGFLPETDNPLEYVWIYENELKLISEQTDYDLINLATRVKQLSQNKVTPGWYNFLSEEELRNLFDNKFRVRTTYLRPRTQSVINGMMIVLKELVELRKIDRQLAEYISNIFDESMYYITPQEKPKFIKSILNNDNYAPSADEKWAHEITDDYLNVALKFRVNNDLIVLAETTEIKGQGDGQTSENRQSFIDRFDSPVKSNLIFSSILKCYYDNYEFGETTNTICYYNWLMTFNNKRNWLAFNAELAEFMGLQLSPQGNFRWLDINGDIVVESIYWQSGEEYNNNRNLHSESGSGWLVVITKEGFELLKQALGSVKLYQHKRIERKLKFYQPKYDTYIDENDENYKVIEVDF